MGKKKQKAVPPEPRQQKPIPPAPNSSSWKLPLLVFCGLICASCALYANSLSNQFVFDDLPIIVDNPLIKSFKYIPQVIGLERGQQTYRPVRFLTYMVDYALSGMNPAAYHLSNFIYHAVTAFILFLVLRMLMRDVAVSLVGALLFLTHPVVTDSVTYISGRRDILVTLFYLLAFYFFVRFRMAPRKWHPVAIIACFILSLGLKEMAATFPLVCLLYDFTHMFMERQKLPGGVLTKITGSFAAMFTRYWKLYMPLGILGAFFFYDKIFVHYPSLVKNFYGGSAASNFATVVRIICYYIKLILFPVVLHADYSYNSFPLSTSFLELRVIGAALIVGACLWFVLRSLKGHVWIFFGGMWFFITLLPVCQIFPHHELMAEHYLYLPLAGVIILFSPLWQAILQRQRTIAIALIACILLLFSMRTVVRNRDWKDPMTLWTSVLQNAPQCARAHDNLGTEYLKIKDYRTALAHYQEAVRLRPEHAIFHNNLGRAYGMLDDMQNAQAELEKAVELNPVLGEAYNNLGIVYYQKKDFKKAAELFWRSAALKPAHMVFYNYAKSVLQLGVADEAIRAFEKAVQYKPDYAEAYQELAIIYWGKNDRTKSQLYLQKALEVSATQDQRQRIEKALDYVKKNDK